MLTDTVVENALKFVEKKLQEAEQKGVYLKIDGHNIDDDWLYIAVTPSRDGVRAVDHGETMAEIEKEMAITQGFEDVLLVPALGDY